MKRAYDSLPSTSAGVSNARQRTMPVQREPTKFTDLVDDCLFEIYKHLSLVDLASIADVCQRLRSTSRIFFDQSKHGVLEYPSSIFIKKQTMSWPIDRLLLTTSKVLRNFGAFVTTFDESYNTSTSFRKYLPKRDLFKFWTKLVQLLRKYCGESLIVLKFHHMGFSNAIAQFREPIFPHVQIFEWKREIPRLNANALLSTWFPEMRELWIGDLDLVRRAVMRKHFKNLTKATLGLELHNRSVKRFLMRNPQLKELHLYHRVDLKYLLVLEYVCEYTKDIEVLRLASGRIRDRCDENSPSFDCFSKLKKLKCFGIREDECGHPKAPIIVRSIVSAGIPLKTLTIDYTDRYILSRYSLLYYISQLKSLEALDLGMKLNSKEDIIRICTQLDQLRELSVDYDDVLDTADVVQIMQVAPRLQWLFARGKTNFDANIYEKLKKVVERRGENSQFLLKIQEPKPSPSELAEVYINRSLWINGRPPERTGWELPSEWCPRIGLKERSTSLECFREWELTVCAHSSGRIVRCPQQHEDLTQFPIRFKNDDLRETIDKHRRIHDLQLGGSSTLKIGSVYPKHNEFGGI